MNYHISGYDEKINQSIVDNSERDFDTMMRVRGGYEVQDMTLQAGKYWTKLSSDTQLEYTSKTFAGKGLQNCPSYGGQIPRNAGDSGRPPAQTNLDF